MTSIEWLAQAFITNSEVTGINNNEWVIKEGDLDRIVKQAKEMHKQEIMQSYNDGKYAVIDITKNKSLEQYYNETFKNQQQ